jgi:uncharacterized membrane protein
MLAFAFAAAELGIVLGPAPIRVAAGLILVFLPGLVVARAIQARMRIDGVEQLLLAPGMSLAIVVLTGLMLNTADIRLTSAHWAIALGLVTAAGLVAEVMLEGQQEVGRDPAGGAGLPAASSGRQGIRALVIFVVAALAVSAAVVIDVRGQRHEDSKTAFTELWALPVSGSPPVAELGVRSHERREVRYSVRVSIDGHLVRKQALTLRPGQTWQSMQPIGRAGDQVEVALLTLPHLHVYRDVHLNEG